VDPRGGQVIVAVVSWNTRDLLLRCLDSLAPEVKAGRADVWVVDNCSSDGSPAAARASAPWARIIEPGRNLGFGSAVNSVAERTEGEWLLAANADIALTDGALSALLSAGRERCVGCVAPRLVAPDGSTEHSVHPFPTVPLTLAFNLGVQRFSPRLGDRLCLEGFWDPEQPRPVPWAIGACLLLRRSAFEAAGGFDGRQWMYAEDVDLAWRMDQQGWRTRYEPAARVLHESGASTAVAFGSEQLPRWQAATYAMLRRRRGTVRMWTTAAINIAGAAARASWMTPLALVCGRWRGAAAENRMWLKAHLQGVRSA
jgi:N-acetylglucosaminyl-diphospho-decaprenol L-rhamnosyltransferase